MFYIIFSFFFSLIVVFSLLSRKYNNPYKLYFIFGAKGSGKSCLMLKRMFEYKKKGYIIYTDMNVNIPGVRIINPDDLSKCWPEENCAIFIDEAQLYWDNRAFKSFAKGFLEFFSLQRKCRAVCFMNSQSFDVDRKIRDRADQLILQTNVGNFLSISRPIQKKIVLTEPSADSESRIAEQLCFVRPWHWKFYYMPSYFKYYNSFEKPFRPPLPYKSVPETEVLEDRHKHIFFRRKKVCPSGSGAQPPESSPVDVHVSSDLLTTTRRSVTEDGRKISTVSIDMQPQL